MNKIGAAVLLFFFCSVPSWAQALIISQVVDGDVWQTTIVLTNTTAATTQASLYFFSETSANATQFWNLPFLEVGSTQSITLAPGETLLLHTPGSAPVLSVGWGELIASPGVVAYAIFTKRPAGFPAQVGTSPAIASASRILVPFDNTSGNVASMAVANSGAAPETITFAIRTTGGTVTQGTLAANFPAQGHAAFTFPQVFPETAGQSGLAEFYSATGTFTILALNFNPAGSLTTAPVYLESGPPIIAGGSGSTGLTGHWTVTAQSSVYGIQSVASGQLTQSGNSVTGQFSLIGTPCAISASVIGTLFGTSLSLLLNENGQLVQLNGTISGDDNSASGTYTTPLGGCTNGDSGTWVGTRQ